MAAFDRIRLIGLLRKTPAKAGVFYIEEPVASRSECMSVNGVVRGFRELGSARRLAWRVRRDLISLAGPRALQVRPADLARRPRGVARPA
jgi:hypothetical protein